MLCSSTRSLVMICARRGDFVQGEGSCPAPAPLPPLTDVTADTLGPFLASAQGSIASVATQGAALEALRALVPREGLDVEVARGRCTAAAGALPWLLAVLRAHGADPVLAGHCVFLLRRVTWAAEDRAPLLALVPVVNGVLAAHGANPPIVQDALAVFANLAIGQSDQVRGPSQVTIPIQ